MVVITCTVLDSTDIIFIDVERPGEREELSQFLFAEGPQIISVSPVIVVQAFVLNNVRRFTNTFFSFPPNGVTQTCITGNISNSIQVNASGERNNY